VQVRPTTTMRALDDLSHIASLKRHNDTSKNG
jgi:hypothetical protein